jgi:hypothetical protein
MHVRRGGEGVFFGGFYIEEPWGQRWKMALELLAEGTATWIEVDDMPDAVVQERLLNAEAIIDDLRRNSSDFARLVAGRQTEFGSWTDPTDGCMPPVATEP